MSAVLRIDKIEELRCLYQGIDWSDWRNEMESGMGNRPSPKGETP
jgi:hypothetical protein